MRFLIVCTSAVLSFSAPTIEACYCSVPSVPKAVSRAKAVFVGEVTEIIEPRTLDENATPPRRFYTIKFRVETSWKGVASPEIAVLSAQGRYGCLAYPPVIKGEKYLVFADPLYFGGAFQKGWLIITICNRTKPLANAAQDIMKLESLKNPSSDPYSPPQRKESGVPLMRYAAEDLTQLGDGKRIGSPEILITINRETCLGGCPSYSAQIYADGTVVYRGDDFVKVKGERRHKVAETRVTELVKAFERIDYFSLKDKYEVDANERSVTDQPRTTTSISLNGRYKKVVDYYCAPKELIALEDLIDKLAGLYEYIGPL